MELGHPHHLPQELRCTAAARVEAPRKHTVAAPSTLMAVAMAYHPTVVANPDPAMANSAPQANPAAMVVL